jgi:hypothetical protein
MDDLLADLPNSTATGYLRPDLRRLPLTIVGNPVSKTPKSSAQTQQGRVV